MADIIKEQTGFPVNSDGEILATAGNGDRTIVGALAPGYIPVDANGNVAINIELLGASYQCANPVVCPNDTVNNVLAQITIPGGSMGKNGRLQIRMMCSYTNNANTKTIKVRFGGLLFAYNCGLASQASANIYIDIINRGSETVQLATPSNINGTTAHATQPFTIMNVDTGIDQLLTFEAQKTVGTDSVILEAVIVEICK